MSILRSNPSFTDNFKKITVPFEESVTASLKAGDLILLTGTIYTARDQTHRRLCDLITQGKELPVDLNGQLLYYVGPSPARPGKIIGAAGPTTSYRMDSYTPQLLQLGLSATLGKGARSKTVREAMQKHGALYFATFGGAGAYLAQCVKSSEVIAFEDAGPEAMFRFEVENFPAVVINDRLGQDYYEKVKATLQKQ